MRRRLNFIAGSLLIFRQSAADIRRCVIRPHMKVSSAQGRSKVEERPKIFAGSTVKMSVIPAFSSTARSGGLPGGAGARDLAGQSVSVARFDRFILGPTADLFFFGPGATVVVAGILLALPLLG